MYRSADSTKKIESKLYLRFDCATHTLYVLVLAEPGVTIRAGSSDHDDNYVKIDGIKKVDGNSGDNGIPPDFSYIGLSGGTAQGWEASFILPEGSYLGGGTNKGLNVHTQVNDEGSQTSAVKNRSIDLVIDCPEDEFKLGCWICETDKGQVVTVVVDEDVTVDFNPVKGGGLPQYSGDPDLKPYFSYDLDGPTPNEWKAIFKLGAKKLLVKNGATITVTNVDNNAPGIEILSDCELEIEEGGEINSSPKTNGWGGDIVIRIAGSIKIYGNVSSIFDCKHGLPANITIASCYGDIIVGPKGRIETVGEDDGGGDINILTCEEGDITINGLVRALFKYNTWKLHIPTINIMASEGSVVIDGNNEFGREKIGGTWYRVTSGVVVFDYGDADSGTINIQADKDITVYGNVILHSTEHNFGAVAIKSKSNNAKGGVIDVRSLGGKITASDRAFDNANRYNQDAKINLLAKYNIELSVTPRTNVGAPDNTKAVVSTQGGKSGLSGGKGGTNTLQSFGGGIIIGEKAQVLANYIGTSSSSTGTNLLISCTGVTNNGEVNPTDANTSDDSGVCTPDTPTPLLGNCAEFEVGCALCKPGIEIKKVLTSSDPTTVGSTVTFQIEIKNTGSTTLTDVDVSDTFDTAYLDFVSANPAETSMNEMAGTITWDNLEVYAPGGDGFDPTESIVITVTFTATATTPDPTKANNCASVSAKYGTNTVNAGPVCDDVEINQAKIVIIKDAIPDDAQDFDFAVTGGPTIIAPFKLDDDGDPALPYTVTYDVDPGSYVVTETEPSGWTLTKIEIIQDPTGDSTTDLAGKKATLNVASGETVIVKFTNEKPLGEVKYDFGDAPDPTYPTFLASNGARHIIDNIWMGATVDDEPDGQPSISADGDDLNPGGGPDDEDGVTFLGSGPSGGPYVMPYAPGQNGAVKIKVTGSVTEKNPAYLHGWVDWNQDGDWNDLGENIFSGYKVTAPGDYTINFPVPADAKTGKTYARFRIDDQNLNSPTGEATNGEVEDYLVDPAVGPPEEPPKQILSRPVGGYVIPANKLAILTPYLALAGLVGVVSAIVVARRRRKD